MTPLARLAVLRGAALILGTLGAAGCSSDRDDARIGADASVDGSSKADGSPSETPETPEQTQICHCPGSCGHPDEDVKWPLSRSCGNGACDGISNYYCPVDAGADG